MPGHSAVQGRGQEASTARLGGKLGARGRKGVLMEERTGGADDDALVPGTPGESDGPGAGTPPEDPVDEDVDQQSDESFPASDPPANY